MPHRASIFYNWSHDTYVYRDQVSLINTCSFELIQDHIGNKCTLVCFIRKRDLEGVGYVDMWDSFVGNEELYFRDGLHLSGKGAAVLAEGLSGAVASGLGKVRYLN